MKKKITVKTKTYDLEMCVCPTCGFRHIKKKASLADKNKTGVMKNEQK